MPLNPDSNTNAFPQSFTCHYLLQIHPVENYRGTTIEEKQAAFIDTLTTAVRDYSTVMTNNGGGKQLTKMTRKRRISKKRKNVKKTGKCRRKKAAFI
jgi:hypothetical protein